MYGPFFRNRTRVQLFFLKSDKFYLFWALRFLVVREIDCGNWLARGYMPAHQLCDLFYALGWGSDWVYHKPRPRFHPSPDLTPPQISPCRRCRPAADFTLSHIAHSPRLHPALEFTPRQISPHTRFHPVVDLPCPRLHPATDFNPPKISPHPTPTAGAPTPHTNFPCRFGCTPDSPPAQKVSHPRFHSVANLTQPQI